MRSHPRSAPLYLDGALVAPPACADTSEPRDKIDTAAATVTMLFAMSSSIWLSRSICAFLMRGIETTLVHRPCRTEIVEHRTTALARLWSGSRLDPKHVFECRAPAFTPPPTPRAPALAQPNRTQSERTAPPDCDGWRRPFQNLISMSVAKTNWSFFVPLS
jgi:hypothetical protein